MTIKNLGECGSNHLGPRMGRGTGPDSSNKPGSCEWKKMSRLQDCWHVFPLIYGCIYIYIIYNDTNNYTYNYAYNYTYNYIYIY